MFSHACVRLPGRQSQLAPKLLLIPSRAGRNLTSFARMLKRGQSRNTGLWCSTAIIISKLTTLIGTMHLKLLACTAWCVTFRFFCATTHISAKGWHEKAAKLGFDSVYPDRASHPSHRQTRYGLFFHSLALIQCLRSEPLTIQQRDRYLRQVDLNQAYLRKCVMFTCAKCGSY